ncbi:MAG: hypothetical protein JSS82_10830 [Bacteroidetes bacterium]|nr:hypothetical protein [Bacteroidota bacterium]
MQKKGTIEPSQAKGLFLLIIVFFAAAFIYAEVNGGMSSKGYLLFTVVGIGTVLAIGSIPAPPKPISNWQKYFDGYQFSAEAFYKQVEEEFKKQEIPGVTFKRETSFQSSVVSECREYLRIKRNEFTFYVCAAIFGTGSYASWWLEEKGETTFSQIPILSKLMGIDRSHKSYYQLDTEGMYRALVQTVVTTVLEEMGTLKGTRNMPELTETIQA